MSDNNSKNSNMYNMVIDSDYAPIQNNEDNSTPNTLEKETTNDNHLQNNYNNNEMLLILSKAVHCGSVQQTIGQYTVTSCEMDRTNPGDEFHILSNELENYDFTPLSSLTIAINTMKDVHYCYYGTADQERVINSFKETIITYYKKGVKARLNVVAWIRKRKCEYEDLDYFFTRYLLGRSFSEFVKLLYRDDNLIKELGSTYFSDIDPRKILCDRSFKETIIKWAKPQSTADFPSDRTRKRIYKLIEMLKTAVSPLNEEHIENGLLSQIKHAPEIINLLETVNLLDKMMLLTRWQTTSELENNPSEEEIQELFAYFATNKANERIISAPIQEWLSPEEGESLCGELSLDQEQIQKWLDNIHFCCVEDNNPFRLCYSFTLFYCVEGPAACWYTTLEKSGNHPRARANLPIDNPLFMVEFSENDVLCADIEKCYLGLIRNNTKTLEELRKFNSIILEGIKG